jgi:hypothetical protein
VGSALQPPRVCRRAPELALRPGARIPLDKVECFS